MKRKEVLWKGNRTQKGKLMSRRLEMGSLEGKRRDKEEKEEDEKKRNGNFKKKKKKRKEKENERIGKSKGKFGT